MGTHSGTFHADEATGIAILRRTGDFKDADLVRSRDPKVCELRVVASALRGGFTDC